MDKTNFSFSDFYFVRFTPIFRYTSNNSEIFIAMHRNVKKISKLVENNVYFNLFISEDFMHC